MSEPNILACCPLDPDEYEPTAREFWDELLATSRAAGEPVPVVYPGSSIAICMNCEVRVAVGPKQQQAQISNPAVQIICHVCLLSVVLVRQLIGMREEIQIRNLGNAWRPAGEPFTGSGPSAGSR